MSAAGFEPTAPGFIPLRLSPPGALPVRGLDCPFTMGPVGPVGAARPVSTPSAPFGPAWLGIGMVHGAPQRSPTLSGSTVAFPATAPNYALQESCALSC